MYKSIKIISLLFILTSCSIIREKQMLKSVILKGVPKTSKWVGGKDGGEWVNFVFEKDSIFFIDTYNDFTNEWGTRYIFKIKCPTVTEKQIKKCFKFTNGQEVFWNTKPKITNCIEFKEKQNYHH